MSAAAFTAAILYYVVYHFWLKKVELERGEAPPPASALARAGRSSLV